MAEQLADLEREAGVPASEGATPSGRFTRLLAALHRQSGRRVVVLVDEYDKPILDAVDDADTARANRDDLRGLYRTIKDCDAHVELTFITGVSMFSKVSLILRPLDAWAAISADRPIVLGTANFPSSSYVGTIAKSRSFAPDTIDEDLQHDRQEQI